ncbi:putative fumarylacetoacetate hydrolase [Xylogone sp. PMI_703]|nr:putative fumarylacetoacetate hydrolase [Xylogone sp. PMI_703]
MGVQIDVPSTSPYTIYNIPFGVISTEANTVPRCASAIGDYAIDLKIYSELGYLSKLSSDISTDEVFSQGALNLFASLPSHFRKDVRQTLIEDITSGRIDQRCMTLLSEVIMHLPMQVGGYSDFYCSLEHCQNCSPMSAGIIPKNWFYAPSVYNSRVSSIIPSPHPVRRPRGVFFNDGDNPTYGPSLELDYELEMGYFVSKPVQYGEELNIKEADEHIFGFVLLNDWSARDLQIFEMKPLGSFHGKGEDIFDIKLKVTLIRDTKSFVLGTSNLRYLYWTPFQQITHHASAMCGLNTGDLMGTGTISGDVGTCTSIRYPLIDQLGCLYEATQTGTKYITLEDGSRMKYLQDNDEIILKAWCESRNGEIALGFGECRGRVLPAFTS